MKRTLFWAVLFFLAGIYASLLLSLKWVFICAVFSLLVITVKIFVYPSKNNTYIIICIFFFLLGGFYISHENSDGKSFISNFKGKTVTVLAKVKSFPEKGERYFSFEARADSLIFENKNFDISENVSIRLYDKTCQLAPGDMVMLAAKVLMPLSSDLIEKDYSLYLKSKRIYTILSVKSGNCATLSRKDANLFDKLAILRKDLCNIFYKNLPEREASVICAMLLGERKGIDEKTNLSFARSGLSHIVAVSGLHVGIICSSAYLLLSFLGISKKQSYIFSLALLLLYIPLTGMSPSAMRAGIMAILFIIAQLILRRPDSLTSLAFAAFLITAENPFYAFSVSFMLSFGATLGILLFGTKLTNLILNTFGLKKESKLSYALVSSLAITLSAQIICFPIILIYFGNFTIWAFLSNILVVPLLMPLFFGAMILLFSYFIYAPLKTLASYFVLPVLKAILFISDFFGGFKTGIIEAEISKETVVIYAVFIFLLYRILSLNEKLKKGDRLYEP